MVIHNEADLTNDAIQELVIKLEKQKIKDGDKSILQIYKKSTKGIYELYRTLDNVYPMYFKSYALDYKANDSTLNEIQGRYSSAEYSEVLLGENTLILKFHSEATMGYNFHYVFDKQKQDWLLQKIEEWKGRRGQIDKIVSTVILEEKSKIGDFNFLDYL